MIKIDKESLFKIEQYYIDLMSDDIHQRYLSKKPNKLVANNPFTGLPYTTIFEDKSGKFDEELINTLLCKSIIAERSSFKQINSYILTGMLVFYSQFSVDKALKDSGLPIKQVLRENLRKDFVSVYSNDWLDPYKLRFPNYYKTDDNFKVFIKNIEEDLMKLNKEISNIIDYSYLPGDDRHYIISNLDVDVCPYCNRQYITSYTDGDNTRTTADLDHFLPKSLFTLLSLSLFNFIPSCQICNLRFKSYRRSELLYPYVDGFGSDAYFTIELNKKSNFDSLIGNNDFFDLKVEVKDSSKNKKQIYNNIEVFKINKVYQIHKRHVRELRYKQTAYKKTYKDMLSELMKAMNLSVEEMELFLYGYSFNKDEFHKKPLSKLTYDIIEDNK